MLKRPEFSGEKTDDASTGKRARYDLITDDDGEKEEEDIPIGEETIAEVMKWLEQELMSSSSPSMMTHLPESCGASFSDQSSTVMASIDMSRLSYLMQQQQFQSIYFFPPPYATSASSSSSYVKETTESCSDEMINGCDESDDDNWLEMCLNSDDAYDPLD